MTYRITKVGQCKKVCPGDALLQMEMGEFMEVEHLSEVAWQLSGGGFSVENLDDVPEPSEKPESWDSSISTDSDETDD